MAARAAMEGEVIFSQKDSDDDKGDAEVKTRPVIKSATDLQRLKLEKLMKNPEKLVVIPELPKEKDYMNSVPTFVRNVMGSSAGAGSGEFHVYRHLRRKEYARQKSIQYKSYQEELNEQHAAKMDENRKLNEEKTAKKRAKRQKRKQKIRENRKKPRTEVVEKESEEDDDGVEDQEEETNDSEDQSEKAVELKEGRTSESGETSSEPKDDPRENQECIESSDSKKYTENKE